MSEVLADSKTVARWMFDELNRKGRLWQEHAVHDIAEKFGEGYTYTNDNDNPAIDRKVLAEFRKLYAGKAEWDNGEKGWFLLR